MTVRLCKFTIEPYISAHTLTADKLRYFEVLILENGVHGAGARIPSLLYIQLIMRLCQHCTVYLLRIQTQDVVTVRPLKGRVNFTLIGSIITTCHLRSEDCGGESDEI